MAGEVSRWLDVAGELLAQPTAPLVEGMPRTHVHRVAEAIGLPVDDDPVGNVVVRYDGPGADEVTPLVLVAHLDHPGFHVEHVDGDALDLKFHGGLLAEHAAAGSPLHLFERDRPDAVGAAEVVDATDHDGRLTGVSARLVGGRAPEGGFAMWGFPALTLEGGRIVGRVCDDLVGVAAALCALEELAARAPDRVAVWGLFTVAEEIGLLGAFEAIRTGLVPRDAVVLSLECSKALADAPQGGGVIVRVGDRASIFDPGVTAALATAAGAVAGEEPGFRWQRKLMDGGTCEATAFCATGYRSSGLALPLGSYHNAAFADDGRPVVGPESVMVDDFAAEVRLLVQLGLHPEWLAPDGQGPAWVDERMEKARAILHGGEA